jgi:hypothetical protein
MQRTTPTPTDDVPISTTDVTPVTTQPISTVE